MADTAGPWTTCAAWTWAIPPSYYAVLIADFAQMLFTWDTTNLCIVFRQWHVRSTFSLVFSLGAIVLLAMGYEALRSLSRRFEASQNCRLADMPSEHHHDPFKASAMPLRHFSS